MKSALAALALVSTAALGTPTSYVQSFVDAAGNTYDATITAQLDIYGVPIGSGPVGQVPSLLYEFSAGVGSDFTVGIPTQISLARTSWVITQSQDTHPWHVDGFNVMWEDPLFASSVTNLSAYCSPNPNYGGWAGSIVLIKRGGCAFADKVNALDQQDAGGVFIVNDNPGAGAQLMFLGAVTTDIPALMLSFERGEQLLASGTDPLVLYAVLEAHFDPISVPEPSTLALFGMAIAGVGFSRRRLAHKSVASMAKSNRSPGSL